MLQSRPTGGAEGHHDDSHESGLAWFQPLELLLDDGRFSLAPVAAVLFGFLTLTSVAAVYLSDGDESTFAFVATSYLSLVPLVSCLWFYRSAAADKGSARTNRLKASVWTLTTLLTFCFGYMVMGTARIKLPVAQLLWFIAAATGIGAFSAFFEEGSTTPDGLDGTQRLREGSCSFSWVFVAVLFGILTLNSVMVVYHSKGDQAIVAFVATSYANLVLLFCCLFLYKRSFQRSAHRNRLKASVWTLTTLLTFSFTYMVMGTAGLTLPVALLLWVIAAATGIGAFSVFFEQASINEAPSGTMDVQLLSIAYSDSG